jgi:hypothetical protein
MRLRRARFDDAKEHITRLKSYLIRSKRSEAQGYKTHDERYFLKLVNCLIFKLAICEASTRL